MSGHSKWANIKRRKEAEDKKRGQRFSKLSRAIMVAAREGGSDPESNVTLRMAIDQALAENMPKDNIERAINRATGAHGEAPMESYVLEGYGPGRTALLLDVVTDNKNRTVSETRKLFDSHGGTMGDAGSTQWMFHRRGYFSLTPDGVIDDAELSAIDAGAQETERDIQEGTLHVFTSPEHLHDVHDQMQKLGYRPSNPEVMRVPESTVPLDPSTWKKFQTLADSLEQHDDIVGVTSNAIPATDAAEE